MVSILSHLSPELEKLMNSANATIEAVLSNQSTLAIFRMNCDILTNFFIRNLKSLIMTALSPERNQMSDAAFGILTTGHIRLLQEIVNKNMMNESTLEILSDPSPTDIQLSRLAEIISYAYTLGISKVSDSTEFLYCLLKRSYNVNVSFLFRMIFGCHEPFQTIQHKFAKMKFPEFIANELFHIKYNKSDNENDIMDPVFLQMESMFKILYVMAQNPIFKSDFRDETVYACLLQNMTQNVPPFVVDAQWQAILVILPLWKQTTTHYFISPAASIFAKVPESIHPYHCHALLILASFLKDDHSFVTSQFLKTILGTFIQFDTCSMFHSAVRNFVFVTMTIKQIRTEVAITFVPLLTIEAELKQYGIISSSAFPILNAIYITSKSDKNMKLALSEIDGFSVFAKGSLKIYQNVVISPYGGNKAKPNQLVLNAKSLSI